MEQQATLRQLSHQQKWTSYDRRRQPNHLFASNDSIIILKKKKNIKCQSYDLVWEHFWSIDTMTVVHGKLALVIFKKYLNFFILQRICSIRLKFCKPHVKHRSLLRNLTRILVNIWRAVTDLLTSKVTTPSVTETIWQLLLLRVSRNTNLSI